MPSILSVFSSCNKTLVGRPTAAHSYYILELHSTIDFAAPNGPHPPVRESSVHMFQGDKESVKFFKDETVKEKLAKAKKLSEVDAKDYDAIFYIGHATLLKTQSTSNWYLSSGLVRVVDTSEKSIFSGKRATAFSNTEEEQVAKVKDVPSLVEDKIKKLGSIYEKISPWNPKVVIVGKLLTGQNPASAAPLGEEILRALQQTLPLA